MVSPDQRRPELAGRRHGTGVVLGLWLQDVGPRMHGPSPRGPTVWTRRRAAHPERQQHLVADNVRPRPATQPRDHLTDGGEPQVGVVEPAAGPVPHLLGAREPRCEVGPGRARRALPPLSRTLGPKARVVREQLTERAVTERRTGQVPLDRVVQVAAALVTQPQQGHRRHGLGDRPQPVLHVGVGLDTVDPTEPVGPGEHALPHYSRNEAGQPADALGSGGLGDEEAGGGRGERDGRHRSDDSAAASRTLPPSHRFSDVARWPWRPPRARHCSIESTASEVPAPVTLAAAASTPSFKSSATGISSCRP